MLGLSLFSAFLVSFSLASSDLNPRILNDNLTPDAYYHNRFHALLAMGVYGDWMTLCPNQTFTKAGELMNFPNATRAPWTVINNFGPTPSGAEGFTVIVPEMNKAVIVFKGNYKLEQTIAADVVPWSYFGVPDDVCQNCTVNAFAAKGYMEAKNETNNWEAIIKAYEGQGLVFSIAGHGLGGMHSLIAAADLNYQKIDYYAHNYGAPRTFNQAGANWYNSNFNGEAAERGVAGNDTYVEYFPAGPDYAFAGTAFYYSGFDAALTGPNWVYCFDGNGPTGPIVDDPGCMPQPQPNSTSAQDHYFYFANVGQCGGDVHQDTSVADAFIAAAKLAPAIGATSSPIGQLSTSTSTATGAGTTKTAGASSSFGVASMSALFAVAVAGVVGVMA